MAYSSGSLILASDYNTFAQGGNAAPDNNVANINTIWAVGTGDKGWGQTAVSTVAATATVTATQWSDLFSRFTSAAAQTNTSVTAISNPVAGNTIDVKTNFSSNLSSIFSNRNNAAAVGTTISSGGDAVRSTSWGSSLTATHTVTWSSANATRYFFNAGGRVYWSATRSGGSASGKNTAWTNLLNACGTIYWTTGTSTQTIAGSSYTGTTKSGGSGSPTTLLTTTGWYDFTTSNVEVFKQFDATYLYTTNSVAINCRTAGSGTQMIVTVTYTDSEPDAPSVDGTLTSSLRLSAPSTTNLSASWGTPTISSSMSGS